MILASILKENKYYCFVIHWALQSIRGIKVSVKKNLAEKQAQK